MRTWIPWLIGLALLAGPGPAPLAAQAHDEEFLRRGRIVVQLFSEGKVAELWDYFGPEMRGMAVSVDQFRRFRENVIARFGTETELLREGVEHADSLIVYERVSRFDRADGPVLARWSFRPDGKLARFHIGEEDP